jgi:DNA-directed RNA polymerase subunit RPC12/RpoP
MKTCAFCSELLEDGVMECPKCQHSRFIQVRTKAPAEKKEDLRVVEPERTLSDMHLLVLERLQSQPGFVNASQFIRSLPLENESQAQVAVMAIQDMVDAGLIEVSGRNKIKITSLGKDTYGREKNPPISIR